MAHGNVLRVANLSKSSLALLDLEVGRDSDLNVVDEVARRLVKKLAADASARAMLTGAPTMVGLIDVRDDRLIYRVAAPTLPGRHDEVRRVWRMLAHEAFRDRSLRQPVATTAVSGVVQPPAPTE